MDFLWHRRCLATVVVGALSWAPALGQAPHLSAKASSAPSRQYLAAPTPDAPASAGRFVALCETKLQLAPAQATALHTYLDQEIDYLRLVALRPPTPDLAPAEAQQFSQVMGRLLSPGQLRQYYQLQQTPQAQAYLHSMALLPGAPASLTRPSKRKTSQMLAQRLDGDE